ncbi:hypothetical protein GCM10010193_47400 [Kitasatospora atroaurantiaca]
MVSALVLALAGAGLYLSLATASRSATTTVAAVQSASPSASPTVDLDAVLATAVAGAASEAEGHVSVAVLDVASGARATYGSDAVVTASIVKADILAALLWQAQQAGRELTAAQKAAAALMIEQSDNTSAGTLFEAVGGADGLDEANQAFGLTRTTAGTDGYWGLTSTTAADQLRLLQVIFGADSVLDADSQSYLQGLMGKISTDQDWGVSAADEDGAHTLKNGWLPRSDSGLWVVNSIGRVTHDGRDVLVAVLSDGNSTQATGIATVESMAVAAVETLTGQASG